MTIRRSKRILHPEAVPGEPQAVRWVTDIDLPVGRVRRAPGTVGPLLEYGVVTKMLIERGGVWMWLADGHAWIDQGPRIRTALAAALDVDDWEIEEGSAELLGLVAQHVLDGELKDYVASHGGRITVADVTPETVVLDFGGACEDCPAAGSTLHERIEAAVVRRYPATVTTSSPVHEQKRGLLGLSRHRR
ncbi:NifU family protein [Tessaracoccus caeni]|uniref:NifU family protein n=1 Tax=Tessaracoccus caeni TaxID=3031239 RepID=UPI0023DA9B24|nr:NifU family protein [Tessaracoccus caeni]MDF1488142.1 NifU family protein [Tessaracoccus caeni]